jgi:type VI secretion system protein ImpG
VAFNKYYQEELLYLREMGEEFARAYPKLAPFLVRKGNDPDVERVLEGFAFIAGRIRQKLDDELPELTHTLISLLWPHFLRPIPSMSILQFSPVANAVSEKKVIPKGVEVDSVPVDGTPCRFQTSSPVDLYPIALADLEVQSTGTTSTLRLTFQLNAGSAIDSMGLDKLRLYLHGELNISTSLYLWFFRHLSKITVQPAGAKKTEKKFTLPPNKVQAVGFSELEDLIPYPGNSFSGYRLLQEYFCLPQKFLFLDVHGLQPVAQLPVREQFEIVF